jgi:hypothetical protein
MERQTMDHDFAVKSEACEKYLLGELSTELRNAYEDHYFSCAECSMQLRSAVEMLGAARQIFAEQPAVVAEPAAPAKPGAWLAWLRPVVAVPVFAALLLLIGYQNLITIPNWKQAAAPRVLPMFSLISANTRGEGLVFSVASGQPFGLYVDVPADPAYATYTLRLEDPSGTPSLLRSLSYDEAQKTQVLSINPAKQAGKYALIVSGIGAPDRSPSSVKELARLQFTVELRN